MHLVVTRLVAVRPPVPLVLAGVRVEDDDAPVAVSVADVDLIGGDVFPDLCRLPEVLDVVAAVVDAVLADLEQKLAGGVELQHLRVAWTIAGQPDVAAMIDGDAMVAVRPVVALTRTSPRFHH